MIGQEAAPPAAVVRYLDGMRLARLAGALYTSTFVLGPFALVFVRGKVFVAEDAAATAGRLTEHAGLFRAGSVTELYLALADVVLAALFYVLFNQVSRSLALVSSLLRLTWAILAATAILTNLAAALSVNRAPGLPLLFLELHEKTLAVGFVAFGAHLVLLGQLIWKSSLMPRIIGIFLVVAGAAYVLNSLLVLGFGAPSRIALLLPALPGEVSIGLWLLVKGVREIR